VDADAAVKIGFDRLSFAPNRWRGYFCRLRRGISACGSVSIFSGIDKHTEEDRQRWNPLSVIARWLQGAACLLAPRDAELSAIRASWLRNPLCVIPNGIDSAAAEGSYHDKEASILGGGSRTGKLGEVSWRRRGLIAIIDHMDERTQRPLPPWQRTARANSISPFEGR
jgi:hypothetical protein